MSVNTRSLTERQRAILKYIKKYITKNGYPPAVRDICKGVGLASSSSVHFHLNSLEKLGFIERDSSKTRAIRPIMDKTAPHLMDEDEAIQRDKHEKMKESGEFSDSVVLNVTEAARETESISDADQLAAIRDPQEAETEELEETGFKTAEEENAVNDLVLYPILNGNLTGAGADFDIDFVPMPTLLVGQGEGFLITMHGDAMKGADIKDGDLCVVKKTQEFADGDILAVIYGGEIIIKRAFRHTDGFILESENPDFVTMIVKEMEILGKVTGLVRINV